MEKPKFYFHWTATPYNWRESGHYHTIVTGDGRVHHLHSHSEDLPAHTYNRNYNSIAYAIACMGGTNYWKEYPPTKIQIENMCKDAAESALKIGYKSEDVTIKNFMTHAEAAANRDFDKDIVKKYGNSASAAKNAGLPHDNYGPMNWHDGWPGGTAERWDLWQLAPSDKGGIGGFLLRKKIKQYMTEVSKPQVVPENQRAKVKAYLKRYCEEYNLSYHDILAQAIIESNLNPDAVSVNEALGVGQIKVTTAEYICKRHGITPPEREELLGMKNAEFNCKLMCIIMKDMLDKVKEKHLYDAARLLYHDGEWSMEEGENGEYSIPYNNKVVKKKMEIKRHI